MIDAKNAHEILNEMFHENVHDEKIPFYTGGARRKFRGHSFMKHFMGAR